MAEVNLYRDSFQNWKSYGIPKAQLIIADIPYGIGEDAYGSNPLWYKGGDNANGESDKAGKSFFHSDYVFRKNYSAQVLTANMRVVGNCEYAVLLYRDKLPKFNNEGSMVMNCMEFPRDTDTPKVHPTQKPVRLLEGLIRIFSDEGDVVIDPCAGSGTTLLAAANMGRKAYGFEIDRKFYQEANDKVLRCIEHKLF